MSSSENTTERTGSWEADRWQDLPSNMINYSKQVVTFYVEDNLPFLLWILNIHRA